MKKRALLIANTYGLNGTKKDVVNLKNFLQSNNGGAWEDYEILKPLHNPSKEYLLKFVNWLKSENCDYVIVLFSGHGGQKRELLIEINENGEKIKESDLKGIAKRQLTIFDCCRSVPEHYREDSILSKAQENFSFDVRQLIRQKYDERIIQAQLQQATLYSCSIGQSSYDTNNGAVYLSNFIKAAKNISGEFKIVGVAHQEAIEPTYQYSLSQKNGVQEPDASLPKCFIEQQLIISINPNAYVRYA
jgi:hypothetical protein